MCGAGVTHANLALGTAAHAHAAAHAAHTTS
jgi:hypothetical protein